MNPASPLRHGAFIHEADDEYVARSVAFLKEGLEVGDSCIFVNTRDWIATMREALGSDGDRVAFIDNGSTYTRPANAVAAYYGTFLSQLRKASSARALAEVQLGPPSEDSDEWMAYEAITNLAYSHLPVWLVCSYNANGLPDRILDGVSSTHPELLNDGWVDSDHFEEPRELVRKLTPRPEPLPELGSFPVDGDLERFREQLARQLAAEKVPEATALDMLIAGTELAANAVRHAGGIEEVRLGRAHGRFVCEVIDRGDGFDDPTAGYIAPREGTGSGLWVARQLTWSLEFFHSPRGFTARVWL